MAGSVHGLLEEGLTHQAGGRLEAAEAVYRTVLRREAENADALHLLGMVANAKGRAGEAVELIRRAIARRPGVAEFYNSLGTVLGGQGRAAEAEAAFREAIGLRGDYAEAHRNLGLAVQGQGRAEEAVGEFRRAVGLRPGWREGLESLGRALREVGRVGEAVGVELELLERWGGTAQGYLAVGLTLRELRRLEEAVAVLRRAVALAPEDPVIHFNLALVLLEAGRFEEGFAEYEWRWGMAEFVPRRVKFGQPEWDGGPLGGRTILLHTEQGLGTNIQFVRYAERVAGRGARVVVACPPALARLFRTVRGVAEVVAAGERLPGFDVHAPLASLPRLMGTTVGTIPGEVPYLWADAERVGIWRERIGSRGERLKVGIVWAGNAKPDPGRTCPVEHFAALAGVEGVRLFSLQKGEVAGLERAGFAVEDLAPWLEDFAETAAAVANLDLVISVDTSVAHLAGALGKRVWTLLPYLADWRWMAEGEESAWYPTMRLFRQARQGEWGEVLGRVARELERFGNMPH